MLQSTKNRATGARIRLIGLIVVAVLSVATWLIFQLGVGAEKLGFAPILLLFTIGFLGTAAVYITYGILGKRTLMVLVGSTSFVFGLIFLLAILKVIWWVVLVITLLLLGIIAVLAFVLKAPQLVVETDNQEGAGHKTYAERKAEEAQEAETTKKEEKPLPEIKSFKD